ncbi:MAG: hypothetical protein K6E78_09970 [Treponema sp.]|nr:hypothetical protein [Treponema sp.]
MDLEREKTYAYVHGKEEGAYEKAIDNARNLLKMNIGTVEQISKAIGLSLEEVLALRDEMK